MFLLFLWCNRFSSKPSRSPEINPSKPIHVVLKHNMFFLEKYHVFHAIPVFLKIFFMSIHYMFHSKMAACQEKKLVNLRKRGLPTKIL